MGGEVVSAAKARAMREKLAYVYGEGRAAPLYEAIRQRIEAHVAAHGRGERREWVSERDVMLITYGDQIREPGKAPLRTLRAFLHDHCRELLSAVHILPFYPYSSDDGFSVIDYFAVDPALGEWQDVEALAADFEIMFDAVINHVSARSLWFQGYLSGDPKYAGYFIEADPEADYRSVTRPRALPLLTRVETSRGPRHVWTTFSDDQIDINYDSDAVLLAIVDLLLFYAARGARFLRLDAVGYLWKRLGTRCIHLQETHRLVQLMRDVLEVAAPGTLIVTETNVPHQDNVSYFGDGHNEAHMVYQFPLPPLTLHSFRTANARRLMEWADALEPTTDTTTFFNFLASHDGIGVMPVRGILTEQEIQALVARAQAHGGYASYKDNGDGTQSPYELNVSYLNALSHPDDAPELKVARLAAAYAILLSLRGVPGIYLHSLLGSENFSEGVKVTGRYRSINREKLDRLTLAEALGDPDSLRNRVFASLGQLIRSRRGERAFHPNAPQWILFLNDHVFSLLRAQHDNGDRVLALINVSPAPQAVHLPADVFGKTEQLQDLVSGASLALTAAAAVDLAPYQAMWLKSQ